jgi:hypothetical protein
MSDLVGLREEEVGETSGEGSEDSVAIGLQRPSRRKRVWVGPTAGEAKNSLRAFRDWEVNRFESLVRSAETMIGACQRPGHRQWQARFGYQA